MFKIVALVSHNSIVIASDYAGHDPQGGCNVSVLILLVKQVFFSVSKTKTKRKKMMRFLYMEKENERKFKEKES